STKLAPHLIGPHDSHRGHLAAEAANVGSGIGRTAQLHLRVLVADDQYRRLSADSVCLAVDVVVGHQVTDHQYPSLGKGLRHLSESGQNLRLGDVAHCELLLSERPSFSSSMSRPSRMSTSMRTVQAGKLRGNRTWSFSVVITSSVPRSFASRST